MPISLLRKTPQRRAPEPVPTLDALSLPDMTQPLIDTDAWHPNMHPHGPTSYNQYAQGTMPRTIPNGGGGGMAAAQRRMTAPHPGGPGRSNGAGAGGGLLQKKSESDLKAAEAARSRAPSRIRDPNGGSPEFHRPFSPAHIVPVPPLPPGVEPVTRAGTMRRARQRRMAGLTVIVAGPAGSGKTSFIDALTGVLDSSAPRLAGRGGPTTSVVRHDLNISDERRGMVIFDTPGLPAENKNILSSATLGRALGALTTMVEDRLARALAEESKVVRRKTDGGELVHLIVYVMDARSLLTPPAPVEIDWDTVMEPPAKAGAVTRPESYLEPDAVNIGARVPPDNIEAMRQLSQRANVLPVLTHADALTTSELTAVRAAVHRDLGSVFGREPLGPWGVLSAGQFDDEGTDSEAPSDRDRGDGRDPSTYPYAVFAPEPGPGFTRAYHWGRADAADPAHSDLSDVRDAVVGAADWLRTSTREIVYEKFRTERLLTARGARTLRM